MVCDVGDGWIARDKEGITVVKSSIRLQVGKGSGRQDKSLSRTFPHEENATPKEVRKGLGWCVGTEGCIGIDRADDMSIIRALPDDGVRQSGCSESKRLKELGACERILTLANCSRVLHPD